MRLLFFVVGILAFVVGLLWIGQSLGYINWPQSSFMISNTPWKYYGAALVVVGFFLVWLSRR